MKCSSLMMVAVALVGLSVQAETQWIDAKPFLGGQLAAAEGYARLPESAFALTSMPKVLRAARNATGLYLAFFTDSKTLKFRYTLANSKKEDGWCGPKGLFGLDAYAHGPMRTSDPTDTKVGPVVPNGPNAWRFESLSSTSGLHDANQERSLRRKVAKGGEEFLVYLPFRGDVTKCEIGVDAGATVKPLAKPGKKIVHYGTSLVHGGCITRGGLLFTSQYARAIGAEVINLGFSGAAHLELEMADIMAAEPCDLYVVDAALNNDAKDLERLLVPFVRRLRQLQAKTPILIAEPASTFMTETDRSLATRSAFKALEKDGLTGLYLLRTNELMAPDSEGTVDGIHPNAWGAHQMAEGFANCIRSISTEASVAAQLASFVRDGAPHTITLAPGHYREKVHINANYRGLTLRAEKPGTVTIEWDDRASTPDGRGSTVGTFGSYTVRIDADDFTAENITFVNSAGMTAGQAVAVSSLGSNARFTNCRFVGHQDTLYVERSAIFDTCWIEGSVDFIFGGADATFTDCDIHCNRAKGCFTAASTPKGGKGYLFRNCRFTGEKNCRLGRPWRPYARVVLEDCYLDDCIMPEGWTQWRKDDGTDKTAYYAELRCKGPGAKLDKRIRWGHFEPAK